MKKNFQQGVKRAVSLVLSAVLALSPTVSLLPASPVYAEELTEQSAEYTISTAGELPTDSEGNYVIAAGESYVLEADLTIPSGKWFSSIEGTLDGNGHTITLSDKPLANKVSGMIENLGIKSDSAIEYETTAGSMAVEVSGTIRNSYSTVNMTCTDEDWNFYEFGGLIGTLTATGAVENCYYAGKISGMVFKGSIAGITYSADIKQCVYQSPLYGMAYGSNKPSTDDNKSVSVLSELANESIVEYLNTNLPDSGFVWTGTIQTTDGYPTLIKNGADVPVNKDGLNEAITKAESYVSSLYTEESWNAVAEALKTAKQVAADDDATQIQVNDAKNALNAALDGLKKIKPTQPVAVPADAIKVYTEDDLPWSNTDKNYVLMNDITIDDYYFGSTITFNGILDGQGHRITFEAASSGKLFNGVGEEGVIQNVSFEGTIDNYIGSSTQPAGPLGNKFQGALINCKTSVTSNNTSAYLVGFARTLDGGVVSNCYSLSTAHAGRGALFYNCTGNGEKILNTYWREDLKVDAALRAIMSDSYPKSASYMKSMTFTELLNANRGDNGTKWGQSSEGYPYFGENQNYQKGNGILPENLTALAFTPVDSEDIEVIENQQLTISPDKVDGFCIAGTFSLPDYQKAKGETIQWALHSADDVTKDCDVANVWIGADVGNLRIENVGEFSVCAYSVVDGQEPKLLASTVVNCKAENMEAIKLYIDGTDVTNGAYSVVGSGDIRIQVQTKYEGASEYEDVSAYSFSFKHGDDRIYGAENSSNFYFKKPGTATVTVTSRRNLDVSAQVEITSTYVPVTSIKMAIASEQVLHGRNPLSSNEADFLTAKDGIIVTPVNASYADASNITITSSQPDVAEYSTKGSIGYVPHKAGTTTFTATLKDPQAGKTYTDSKKVTYTYLNPLEKVTADTAEYSVKNGTVTPLDLTFTGSRSEEGYSVTQPELVWTYSEDGIVKIDRKVNGAWKRDESAKDNGLFLASSEYYIYAEGTGTVTATGTPVDTTAGAKPVTVTITVTKGTAPKVDTEKLIRSGVKKATEAYWNQYQGRSFAHGDEWLIYAMVRSGKTLTESQITAYYASVAETVKDWSATQKPTDIERTALALSLLGYDITNVEGVNLAVMIYNHPDLDAGSNELIYALLALDARNTAIPENAKWTREKMVQTLLTFQNPTTGGFGLYDADGSDADLTAMALQALAPYQKSNAGANAAIKRGLEYLKTGLNAEYAYTSPSTGAQVLLTLAALKLDVNKAGFGNEYRNLVSTLYEMILENSKVSFDTLQVYQAFEAYRRYIDREASYWDLTGIALRKQPATTEDTQEPTTENTAEPTTETSQATTAAGTETVKQTPVQTGDAGVPLAAGIALIISMTGLTAAVKTKRKKA